MAENKFGVGVRYMKIAPIKSETDTALPTYDSALDIGSTNAIKMARTTKNNTADGDDAQVANITVTTGMAITWTGWGVPDATAAKLYGHTIDETTSEMGENMDDLAPYVGFGYIRTFADKTNSRSYTAYFYPKAQAVEGDEEATSAGSDMTLSSTEVVFNAVAPSYGKTRYSKSFTSESEAKTWINTKLGISTT